MRTIKKYPFSLTEDAKTRLLHWAQQFEEVIWLDSNRYSQKHETYQAILAVDAFTALKTDFHNAFDNLKEYQAITADWIFGYLTYDLKNDLEKLHSKNFDGLGFGYICLTEHVPYMIISQKAVEVHWPYHLYRVGMRNVYLNAKKSFFVSHHNLKVTQEQFGTKLQNASVIYNPVKVKRYVRDYPKDTEEIRLICMGRMFLLDKGQDILIKILHKDRHPYKK